MAAIKSKPLILEEAREAVIKLQTLKPFLSPRDEETLSILMDKKLLAELSKSLEDARTGRTEPLRNILK
ncbi:hypothetical protein A3B18_03275 [Candidatus Giovannonibacteria bacterium RIFCSPLOWO2_01_FULL_46_13]|uniref:Uncharacterized protein n=1 Tax=Candidatus Giovannonibacteria bacterium RIFCSPLOWO2_01_FULL_46_13 TaxID=1798352 RepID=A0A1F5X5V1_9BACT|nr:MAG: hypothetical protein A3B18_03275 [Candidatus Giovannonibacteria bacterium RIFCSPLOWO2_01_FULL_46_13]